MQTRGEMHSKRSRNISNPYGRKPKPIVKNGAVRDLPPDPPKFPSPTVVFVPKPKLTATSLNPKDLGRTTPMAGIRPESKHIMATLSYWRDLKSLHDFTFGPAHRAGWDWWNSTVKQHPHLGIFHEVYVVPKDQWTNVYVNFPPFGMGELSRWRKLILTEVSADAGIQVR